MPQSKFPFYEIKVRRELAGVGWGLGEGMGVSSFSLLLFFGIPVGGH